MTLTRTGIFHVPSRPKILLLHSGLQVAAGIPNSLEGSESWFFLGLLGEGRFDPLIQPPQSVDLDKEICKLLSPQRHLIRSHAPAVHGVPRHTHVLSQFRGGDFQLLENGFEFLSMHDGEIETRLLTPIFCLRSQHLMCSQRSLLSELIHSHCTRTHRFRFDHP